MGAIAGLPVLGVGEAGAGEPGPDAPPAPRHALREPGRAGHELPADGDRRRSAPRSLFERRDRSVGSSSTSCRSAFADPVLVRARQPVPRVCSTCCPSRRSTAPRSRAGPPGDLAAALVQVPALRVPRAVPARVLDRGDLGTFLARRSDERTSDPVRRSLTMKRRAPRRAASCGRCGRGRRAPADVAWVEAVLTPDGLRAVPPAAEPRPTPRDRRRPRRAGAPRRHRVRRRSALAGGRAAARHRQARLAPRRLRPGRWRRSRARRRGASTPRRGRSRAASPAGSASTCATPSSAATASASPAEPEEAARWSAAPPRPRQLGRSLPIPEPVVVALDAADND